MLNALSKEKEDLDIPILKEIDEENQFNLDKYKIAGNICESALSGLKTEIVEGSSISSLCQKYDDFLIQEVKKTYKDKSFNNGLAFPTTISVNNMASYNTNERLLKNGDLVKLELGLQIDGFPVVISDTVMIGDISKKQKKVLDCLEEIKKNIKSYIKIGKNNKDVSTFLTHTVKKYECNLLKCDEKIKRCPGVFSYQISQDVIDGYNDNNKNYEKHEIIFGGQNQDEFDVDTFEFQHNQVFIMDVAISSGEGYVSLKDTKETTVYKYNQEFYYPLRLKASRQCLETLKKEGQCFPCNISKVRDSSFILGLNECIENNLIEPYHILYEKDGEYIANYKFTVILRNGNKKIKNRNIYFN